MKCKNFGIKCNIKNACFNFKDLKPEFCKPCSLPGMIDLKHKMCIDCGNKRASFGLPGEKPEYCNTCSDIKMKNLNYKKCIICKNNRAYYNYAGESPMYCKEDYLENMIYVGIIKCKCGNSASLNYPNEPKKYCSSCALPGMVNVSAKKCKTEYCNNIQPQFNFKGKDIGIYCFKCKTPEMVDVVSLKCIKCNEISPSFNFKGKKEEFCFKCKTPEMVDVRNKKCIEKNCDKQPSFNYITEKIRIYCRDHCLENMIDITHKKCLEKNCLKQSNFNFITEKTGIYCSEHAEKFMVNIVDLHFNCSSCGLRYREHKKGITLCGYCNPDRNHKTKENEIKKLLEKNNYTFIQDKSIALDKTVCKSYRPDFLFDCNFHYVIIEVDEFKHRGTANTCDYNRMEAIQKILGLPVTFIRYNPDSKETSKLERESKLLEKLDFYLDLKIQKLDLLTINYLFY